MQSYFQKIQEYNNHESRDLWEFRLNLSPSQLRFLSFRLWEISGFYSDYYFFDENCSYALLILLESLNSSWKLTSRVPLFTIPADTLRVVKAQPSLVSGVKVRPSVLSRFLAYRRFLTRKEQQIFAQLVEKKDILGLKRACSLKCQVKVLDAAIEWVDYREELAASMQPKYFKKFRTQLLASRANLRLPSPKMKILPMSTQPDLGHDSSIVGLTLLSSSGGTVSEFYWRPALHDLTSLDLGYSPRMQLGFFDIKAQVAAKGSQLRLAEFKLLEIFSLPLHDRQLNPLAWRLALLHEDQYLCDGSTCRTLSLRGGIGKNFALGTPGQSIFSLVETAAGQLWDQNQPYILTGLHSGLILTLGRNLKLLITARLDRLHTVDASFNQVNYGFHMRWHTNINQGILAKWQGFGDKNQWGVGLFWHF